MLARRAPFVLLLLLLLPGCGMLLHPQLETWPESYELDSYRLAAELRVRNVGSPYTTLQWTAGSPSPRVTVTPDAGAVRVGLQTASEQTVIVSVDPTGLDVGDTFSTVVEVTSNGGRREIPLTFTMTVSLACDAAPGAATRSAAPAAPGDAGPTWVPGELLVALEPPAGFALRSAASRSALRAAAADLRGRHGLELVRERAGDGPDLVRVAGGAAADLEALAAELAREPGVRYAHPNYRLRPLALPNDECLYEQWPLGLGGMSEAWDVTTGDTGTEVVLAVLDSGVDTDHADLASKMLAGWDVHDDDADPNPGLSNGGDAEHGTHVAGIAAAVGDNGTGIAGIAYGARVKVLPVKVFDDTGRSAAISDLVDALEWAGGLGLAGAPANPTPADVINMSVGAGAVDIPAVNDVTQRLYDAGVVLVAAAGNYATRSSSAGVQSPANAPGVIAVGSVDSDYVRSYFSDFGSGAATVDVMAPGGFGPSSCTRVRSTFPNHVYGCLAGTSMASPYVAGLAALLLTREPTLTPGEVLTRLRTSALYDASFMDPDQYGAGVVCGDALLGAPSRCGR